MKTSQKDTGQQKKTRQRDEKRHGPMSEIKPEKAKGGPKNHHRGGDLYSPFPKKTMWGTGKDERNGRPGWEEKQGKKGDQLL